MNSKKGILVVSFGTSYGDTLKKTIGAIEESIDKAFDGYKVYRAFTSRIIKAKLDNQGTPVYNAEQAFEAMIKDGVTDEIIVQPTYVINGIEYDMLTEEIEKYRKYFKTVKCGTPLLTKPDDYRELATIIKEEFPTDNGEALVLMGHGSEHHANSAYPAFEYALNEIGYYKAYVGTVEGYPSLKELKAKLKKNNIKKVCLVPLMIVAGDHANNDMIGSKNSWKSELEEENYNVRYYLRGLGELKGVQNMFIKHIQESFE